MANVWTYFFGILFLGTGALYSVRSGKLTLTAALAGVLLALLVYGGAGFAGLGMMAFFFLAGSAATSWKLQWKKEEGLAENEKGTRSAGQVLANAGVPALAGLVAVLFPATRNDMRLMIAGAFSAATADTLSSELGNIYGRRFYNILSFKRDRRGENGVVSLEGTLCGLAGSAAIAGIYAAAWGIDGQLLTIVLAGTLGNIFDSILGASWERKHHIGNNMVNFLNTAVAALSALALGSFN